jgi:hypothetical protein
MIRRLRAIRRFDFAPPGQTKIRLVNESRRPEGVAGIVVAKLGTRKLAQLVIHDREKPVERFVVAFA